jgi:hypothetical protein
VTPRRLVRLAALALAGAALAWALVIAFYGGFEFEVSGIPVTSYEPLRPLILAALALAVFVVTNGVERSERLWTRAVARFSDRSLVLAMAGAVVGAGIVYNTTAASGPDQYGYVSQADLWLEGNLHVPQPWAEHVPWPSKRWTFAPLGYRPVEEEGRWENVPTYSPGLPLLMAAAKAVGGQEALFAVVPLFGGLMVLATWGVGRRLGSSRGGLVAAWLVATSPAFLLHLVVPMSDVAAAGAWTMAVYFLLVGGVPATAAAGIAAGVAMMIRPNLFLVAAVTGLYAVFRRIPPGAGRGHRIACALAFGLPLVASGLAIAAIYQSLYGSPFVSGYGRFSDQFAWASILPNIRNYFSWFVDTQTVIGLVGLAVVLVPLRRVWPGVPDRRALAMIAALVVVIWTQYFAYLVFDNFRYLRFLLPTWPFVMLGVGVVAVELTRRGRPSLTLATAGLVLAVGITCWRQGAREGAFSAWRGDRRFIAVAELVRERTPPNSAVLAMIHSGSLRYYGGRMTIRYDILDKDWLDRGVEWLTARGVPVYALLEEWEIEPFATRFSGERLAEGISRRPILEYRTNETIRLYDLSAISPAGGLIAPAVLVTERFIDRRRSALPAPAPTLVFAP